MNMLNKTRQGLKLGIFLLIFVGIFSCKKDETPTNAVIEAFRTETGIDAVWVEDTTLLNTVKGWQGSGDYPGVDDWATATIPAGLDLYGGLPGQSEYYALDQAIIAADTVQVAYWESLQVKAHPTFGYRPEVGIFEVKQTITVAISKTLTNPQYGAGGAWQLYVENYTEDLTAQDTITLKQ